MIYVLILLHKFLFKSLINAAQNIYLSFQKILLVLETCMFGKKNGLKLMQGKVWIISSRLKVKLLSLFFSLGLCQPRMSGVVGAEPFSAKLRYTGPEDPAYTNLIKLTVTMPHIDGMIKSAVELRGVIQCAVI